MFENFLRARADQHENAETLFQQVLAQGSDPTPQEDFARARLESRIGPPARAVQMAPGLLSWFLFNRGIPDV